jgi:hypothetical protein
MKQIGDVVMNTFRGMERMGGLRAEDSMNLIPFPEQQLA